MMRNIVKSCSFCVLIGGLTLTVVSVAWAEDQEITQYILQQNTEKIKKITSELQTIQQTNEEILEGINYLRIRIHKKGGGRRPDLEVNVDCLEGQNKCENNCGKTCKKRCANACNKPLSPQELQELEESE